jgi:hypothetical protein
MDIVLHILAVYILHKYGYVQIKIINTQKLTFLGYFYHLS